MRRQARTTARRSAAAKSKFVACVNGPAAGASSPRPRDRAAFDLIQEWGFGRAAPGRLGQGGRRADRPRRGRQRRRRRWSAPPRAACSPWTSRRASSRSSASVPGSGRIALGSKGSIFGQDGAATRSGATTRRRRKLDAAGGERCPAGAWDKAPLTWARDHQQRPALHRRRRGHALLLRRGARLQRSRSAGRSWRRSARWP